MIPPIHLGIVTYLIYLELGWTAFLTIAFIVVYVLLQIILGRLHTHWRYGYLCSYCGGFTMFRHYATMCANVTL